MYSLYVASFDKSGGIYHYEINGKEIALKQFVPLERPMYFVLDGGKMYVLLRDVRDGESGVVSFDVDGDGNLKNKSEPLFTKGEIACHLAVDNGRVYAAHYGSGSLFASPDTSLKLSEKSKMHFVGLTPDGKYLCVCDLGLDKIYLFDKDLALKSEVKLKEGSGPRHICFDKAGKYVYCACELSSEVVSFKYSDGELKMLGTVSAVAGYEGENHPAAIRISGDRLYVSNRGADSVSVFSLCEGKAELINSFSSRGKCPRDIFLLDNLLICANQESDNVSVFEIKNDNSMNFLSEIKVKAPLCAMLKR
ncbi:MAG: lactonase family protein [Oscillospiraceae bacterium]|nr:lactonase family protein [Oscillospiraceae bacterium]